MYYVHVFEFECSLPVRRRHKTAYRMLQTRNVVVFWILAWRMACVHAYVMHAAPRRGAQDRKNRVHAQYVARHNNMDGLLVLRTRGIEINFFGSVGSSLFKYGSR